MVCGGLPNFLEDFFGFFGSFDFESYFDLEFSSMPLFWFFFTLGFGIDLEDLFSLDFDYWD